ncbi:4-hydroxy-tetrahydrodipicolinate synthase [Thalassobacillus devorans]|uniref:4-hydroxy-tetrahydrodipicolinate synthase n=1 Tax=Thalassobacillus devorans TaxID=279813 RepID=UPI0004915A2C|nr:4-hydroxy-tetrahydrodipicolinate synthase [Thalassobacillus devorans]
MNFGRLLTAMVTPFDNKGNIDFEKTTKLVNYLINNGSDGLVVAGTTGESPTLTSEEKAALWKHTVEVVNKRVPVIAGSGSNNTHASIELTRKAENAGVDAVMLVTPYYNKPNQHGLYQHFKSIAHETKLPVMLYNVPGRSIVPIAAETVITLSKIPNIVSLKDASKDFEAISEMIERTPENFTVYGGEDSLTLPIRSVGASGIVSVASHVIGKEMQEMLEKFDQGDVEGAAEVHRKLIPIMSELFKAPSPVPVKTALQIKGMDVGGVRLPLVPLTPEERERLVNVLQVSV